MRVTLKFNNITQKYEGRVEHENAEPKLVFEVASHADALALRRSYIEEQEPAPLCPDDWKIV